MKHLKKHVEVLQAQPYYYLWAYLWLRMFIATWEALISSIVSQTGKRAIKDHNLKKSSDEGREIQLS